MLTISGKAIGTRKRLFADFSVDPPPDLKGDGGVTLRELVEHVVREEVAAFRQRQQDRVMFRALTARQIEEAAERGKIASGGSEIPPQNVDGDAAVDAALTAFEDGLYFVVVDDQQAKELDQQVFLGPDSRITFIRLTLLAGG
jgi:hypothetical protein